MAAAAAGDSGSSATATTTTAPAAGGANAAGKKVFASAGCGGCHALADAGAAGTVGPSLDESTLSAAQMEGVIANGQNGMPAYEGQLTAQQIAAVADYVSQARR